LLLLIKNILPKRSERRGKAKNKKRGKDKIRMRKKKISDQKINNRKKEGIFLLINFKKNAR